jgi:hypothetical protein
MADENKVRDAADAIKGLVEAVPIYQDVVQPAAKEVGTALQTIAKTVHIALAPVSAVVWGYDKIRDYLQETLTEKLKNVPPERIAPPPISVAGPAVEALRFAANEPSLREMYANLLAAAMDSKTTQETHPAFVELIRQLAPDEALLINHMSSATIYKKGRFGGVAFASPFPFPVLSGEVVVASTRIYTGARYPLGHYTLLEKKIPFAYSDMLTTYIENLCRLGITRLVPEEEILNTDPDQRAHYSFDQLFESARAYGYKSFKAEWETEDESSKASNTALFTLDRLLMLTPLGLQFCETCVVDKDRV